MIAAAGMLVAVSTADGHGSATPTAATMVGYVVGFIAIFVLCGIGSGSLYKMIPAAFETRSRSLNVSEADRRHWSRTMPGAVIGFVSATGTLGGVMVNLALRQSYLSTGAGTAAFWFFLGCYVACSGLTWAMYVRRPAAGRSNAVAWAAASRFASRQETCSTVATPQVDP